MLRFCCAESQEDKTQRGFLLRRIASSDVAFWASYKAQVLAGPMQRRKFIEFLVGIGGDVAAGGSFGATVANYRISGFGITRGCG